jgi:hypothetical protein
VDRVVRARKKIALRRLSLAALALLIAGCQRAGPLGRAGVALTPPESWHPVPTARVMVPGVPLAAWSGPDGSSLVVFRTLWVPGGTAEMLTEALANRLDNLPGLRILVRRAETVAGTAAGRVEAVAPGTGDALAASGLGTPMAPEGKALLPTREVTLVLPRPAETLYLTWHLRESSYDRIAPEIEATLASLRLSAGDKTTYAGN